MAATKDLLLLTVVLAVACIGVAQAKSLKTCKTADVEKCWTDNIRMKEVPEITHVIINFTNNDVNTLCTEHKKYHTCLEKTCKDVKKAVEISKNMSIGYLHVICDHKDNFLRDTACVRQRKTEEKLISCMIDKGLHAPRPTDAPKTTKPPRTTKKPSTTVKPGTTVKPATGKPPSVTPSPASDKKNKTWKPTTDICKFYEGARECAKKAMKKKDCPKKSVEYVEKLITGYMEATGKDCDADTLGMWKWVIIGVVILILLVLIVVCAICCCKKYR